MSDNKTIINIDDQSQLMLAVESNDVGSIRAILSEYQNYELACLDPSLRLSISLNNGLLTSYFLDLGADPNLRVGEGLSPFELAIFLYIKNKIDKEILDLIELKGGDYIDIDGEFTYKKIIDNRNDNLLELIDFFIEKGVEVNQNLIDWIDNLISPSQKGEDLQYSEDFIDELESIKFKFFKNLKK